MAYWESCWRLATRVFGGDGFHFVNSRFGCISLESSGNWLTFFVNLTEFKVPLRQMCGLYWECVPRSLTELGGGVTLNLGGPTVWAGGLEV